MCAVLLTRYGWTCAKGWRYDTHDAVDNRGRGRVAIRGTGPGADEDVMNNTGLCREEEIWWHTMTTDTRKRHKSMTCKSFGNAIDAGVSDATIPVTTRGARVVVAANGSKLAKVTVNGVCRKET